MVAATKTPSRGDNDSADSRDLQRLKTAARVTGKGSRATARAMHRKRRMLAPFPVYFGVAALPALQLIPLWGTVLTVLLAVGAPAAAGWIARRKAELKYLTPTWVAGWSAAGGGWLIASLFLNPYTAPMLLTLKGMWAAGFAPWWWRHHSPVPTLAQQHGHDLPPPEAPEPEPQVHIPWQIELYQQHLARQGQALAGTWADELQPIPYGFQLTVHWPIGRTYDELWSDAVRRAIRSVFDVPDTQISAETFPGRPPRRARLMVLTEDPLRQTIPWPGPDVTEGITSIGLYADGAKVPWRFWEADGGAAHGLVYGCSGSGKSKLLAILMLTVLQCRWMTPWFLDGQHGASSPTLMHYVNKVGRGPNDSLTRLREIKAIMDDRSARMPYLPWTDGRGRRRQGVGKITPDASLPQIVVFMDEAQNILSISDEAARIVAEIVATGRKVGISLVLLTQVPSAGSLNSLTGMREQLKAFNVMVLRLREHFTTNMGFSGRLDPPPHELPERFDDGSRTYGLGFKPDDRPTMMRAAFVPDDDELDHAENRVDTPLEPEATRAAETVPNESADSPAPAQKSGGGAGGSVTDMISEARTRLLSGQQETDTPDKPTAADSKGIVLRYLEEQETAATGDIVGELEVSRTTVYRALNELVNEGKVNNPKKGLYEINY